MSDDISTAAKIGMTAVILCFIISIAMSIVMIGRNLLNQSTKQLTAPIVAMEENDAFFLASYQKPVPIADIWKVIYRFNYGQPFDGNGNIKNFSLYEPNPTNPNDWQLLSQDINELANYMDRKAYLSWSVDEITGFYTMEVKMAS